MQVEDAYKHATNMLFLKSRHHPDAVAAQIDALLKRDKRDVAMVMAALVDMGDAMGTKLAEQFDPKDLEELPNADKCARIIETVIATWIGTQDWEELRVYCNADEWMRVLELRDAMNAGMTQLFGSPIVELYERRLNDKQGGAD